MHKRIGGIVSFLALALLCGVISLFNVTSTYATDSITLNIDTNNLVINSIPSSSAGDFAKSNNMNISVSTTSTSGYTLGIASSTGSTDLTNQSDNTAKITSLASPISESDFSNSSNTQYNNKWGYKPSQYATLDSGGHPTIHPNTNFRPLPGTTPEIIAKTECANGTAPCTNPTDTYTISIGARANNQTKPGSYNSDTFIITAVANVNVVMCDSSKLCVEYEGNGLSFPETSTQDQRTVNNVNYNSTTTQAPITKYAHTPNVSDEGIASGEYSSNMDTTDTVTIDGATSLNVTIYYDAESTSWDWVSVYQSPFDISNTNDATVSTTTGNLSGKLSGRNSGRTTTYSSWYTQSYTVSGDTVKFHFRSDNSGNYYGYYAIITGTGTVYDRSVSSGEYATPTGTNPVFHGWSTSQTTPGGGLPSDVEYANESEILAKMPGDEGETKTLYAVWQQGYPITFTYDSNVTKIDVLDASGTTVGTITSSGQSLILAQGDTYTIKPTHVTGYITNTITKTSGAGTISGNQFTVGAGAAALNVTSRQGNVYCTDSATCMQTSIACDTTLTDGRDGATYTTATIADTCWMTQNLRFTGGELKAGESDVTSDITMTYGQLTDGNSYTEPRIATGSTTDYGTYYNYCAASAGEVCNDTTQQDATRSVCPAGWKLPTQAQFDALPQRESHFASGRAGNYYDGSPHNAGAAGYWWASTATSATYQYRLFFSSGGYWQVSGTNKYYGYPVRCVRAS